MSMFAIILGVITTFVAAPGPFYLKKVSTQKFGFSIFKNKYIYYSAFFYLISTIMVMVALKYGDLSAIGPIFSLVYVWVTLISIKVLGEKINKKIFIGIALIVIGMVLVSI